jgi:hypothetical protein
MYSDLGLGGTLGANVGDFDGALLPVKKPVGHKVLSSEDLSGLSVALRNAHFVKVFFVAFSES